MSDNAVALPRSEHECSYMEKLAGWHLIFRNGYDSIKKSYHGSAWSFGCVRSINMRIFRSTFDTFKPLAVALNYPFWDFGVR